MGLENIEGLNDVELMKKIGAKEGDALELILYEGAEYDNGWSPAPTIDPIGYKSCNKMGKEKGLRLIGYIQTFDIQNNRIFLSLTKGRDGSVRHDFGRCYVNMDCIYAVRFI